MMPPWVPADCFACKRCASLGIGKTKIQSICWECAQVAEELRLMKRPALDRIEQNALVAAGDAGGQFLDEVGQTDLAALAPEDYAEYVRTVVLTFGDSVREQVQSGIAPF